ncbi:MAG: hypothetical protein R8J84_03040 [Mariprofundales bacterium]
MSGLWGVDAANNAASWAAIAACNALEMPPLKLTLALGMQYENRNTSLPLPQPSLSPSPSSTRVAPSSAVIDIEPLTTSDFHPLALSLLWYDTQARMVPLPLLGRRLHMVA